MQDRMISIAGLNKADVLAALHNNAKMHGRGILHASGSGPMTREQAAAYLAQRADFDYLQGRVMKLDLSGEEFDPRLYDRDNGAGKAARVVAHLRKTGSIEEII
jgi:hypothetical protein